jgi:hypothetical protein
MDCVLSSMLGAAEGETMAKLVTSGSREWSAFPRDVEVDFRSQA